MLLGRRSMSTPNRCDRYMEDVYSPLSYIQSFLNRNCCFRAFRRCGRHDRRTWQWCYTMPLSACVLRCNVLTTPNKTLGTTDAGRCAGRYLSRSKQRPAARRLIRLGIDQQRIGLILEHCALGRASPHLTRGKMKLYEHAIHRGLLTWRAAFEHRRERHLAAHFYLYRIIIGRCIAYAHLARVAPVSQVELAAIRPIRTRLVGRTRASRWYLRTCGGFTAVPACRTIGAPQQPPRMVVLDRIGQLLGSHWSL